MKEIYLLCGVPGSGKTWVAKQLSDFKWVPHDDHDIDIYHRELIKTVKSSDKPVLAEAPFRISMLVDQLKRAGIKVRTYYVTGPERVIKSRYEARMKKSFPKQHSTNLKKYDKRRWDFRGTSGEVLDELKKLSEGT